MLSSTRSMYLPTDMTCCVWKGWSADCRSSRISKYCGVLRMNALFFLRDARNVFSRGSDCWLTKQIDLIFLWTAFVRLYFDTQCTVILSVTPACSLHAVKPVFLPQIGGTPLQTCQLSQRRASETDYYQGGKLCHHFQCQTNGRLDWLQNKCLCLFRADCSSKAVCGSGSVEEHYLHEGTI